MLDISLLEFRVTEQARQFYRQRTDFAGIWFFIIWDSGRNSDNLGIFNIF